LIVPADGVSSAEPAATAGLAMERLAPMEPPETLHVETRDVCCDGGGGALGHPAVYLTMAERGAGGGQIDCPYCGRRFVLKESAETAPAH